ncbi:MAG: riboflavin biosynthesis protein RibF [Moraxella sp.]
MQIIHLDPKNPPPLPKTALTIGNFDGVHLGHKTMLYALKNMASQQHLHTAVMIFEPQPREFFTPNNPPARLSNLAEKSAIIKKLDIDYLLVVDFNDEFRSLSALDFTQLLKKLNANHLMLGDDFRFGHDRLGDKKFLQNQGFIVDNLTTICHQNARISSTQIRHALSLGDLTTAKMLLGQDYSIKGTVVHGDKIGRTLGFPTANISLSRLKPALKGVFGANVLFFNQNDELIKPCDLTHSHHKGILGIHSNSLLGAVNIGTRPSVHGADYRLEVYFPDFDGNLYGLTAQVIFLHYLHDEKKYADLSTLQSAIGNDIKAILDWQKAVK